ncbi:unnamed protein product, partial [marine sediment metagenome]
AEFIEATRRGDAGYKIAFDTNNAMIARALLVGTLLMDTGEKGSWALSKTHFDIFIYILDYLGTETEDHQFPKYQSQNGIFRPYPV